MNIDVGDKVRMVNPPLRGEYYVVRAWVDKNGQQYLLSKKQNDTRLKNTIWAEEYQIELIEKCVTC